MPRAKRPAFNLGPAIKEARTSQGLTLREAGELCGIDLTYICRLEAGERCPTLPVLVKLARGLGVELATILRRDPVIAAVL